MEDPANVSTSQSKMHERRHGPIDGEFRISALCDQHAEDPNFDEEKAYGRCLDEAWRTVLD